MARTGFHPAPGVDVSDADAGVGDVKDPKTFYSVAAPKKTGTMPTQTLDPANEDVNAGYYAETTLSAVDEHLAAGNIKDGVDIFGFAGTVAPGGVETIDKYADAEIANNATYTPGDAGIFYCSEEFLAQHFSTGNTAWYATHGAAWKWDVQTFVGDGVNSRIKNGSGGAKEYILLRHHYSTGTYDRIRDADLAQGTAYTPAENGFFSEGSEFVNEVTPRVNFTTAGWLRSGTPTDLYPWTVHISDGINWQMYNTSGARADRIVIVRAKMA
ncbi:hypothetical protein ES707_11036 [subsurface metagenome]